MGFGSWRFESSRPHHPRTRALVEAEATCRPAPPSSPSSPCSRSRLPAVAGRLSRRARSSSARSRTPPRAARRRQDAARAAGGVPRDRAERRLDAAARGAAGSGAGGAREPQSIAAATNGIRPIVAVYSFSSVTPTTPAARAQFAAYAASIPRLLPGVRDVIVGNEPNLNLFWLPQFGRRRVGRRGGLVPRPARGVLRRAQGRLPGHQRDRRLAVGARERRPGRRRGRPTRRPGSSRISGPAYRASGRDQPVMDMFSIHPYPENSSIPPTFEHPQSTSIGLADYDKLVALLGAAFDGTDAAGLVAPDRLRRVRPPDGDPAAEARAVHRRRAGDDEADRRAGAGDRIRRRDRDRGLPPDGADAALLPRLGRAAARAPPDRRLLRRRHTEIEPGADRPARPSPPRRSARSAREPARRHGATPTA